MIGLVSQIESLYMLMIDGDFPAVYTFYFQFSISISKHCMSHVFENNCKVIPNKVIWSFRFGHLIHDRLNKMSQLNP